MGGAIQTTWCPAKAKQDIAEDKYVGYELSAAKNLMRKLPIDRAFDFEEVKAYMRLYAIEAPDKYNPTKKAAFPTFLFGHLRQRSYQWLNWAWLKKNHPEGKSISNFSFYEKDEPFDIAELPQANLPLDVKELMNSLSDEARVTFGRIVANSTEKLLLSVSYQKSICQETGLTPMEIEAFLLEIRVKAPKYVGGIS